MRKKKYAVFSGGVMFMSFYNKPFARRLKRKGFNVLRAI